jgi:type II secretory pathway pseudopilin PulG
MKKFFNMIELTLAIAVVGIGMVGIMALFPVGVNASRDAVGDNYAADSVEQMLTYIATACQDTPATLNNWTTYVGTVATDGRIKEYAYASQLYDDNITVPTTRISNTNIFTTTLGNDIYGIKQPATGNADFTAHVKLWKAKIENMTIAGSTIPELPYYNVTHNIGAARIYAEVSWPVEKPYSKRTKRTYSLELFKQN